MRKKFLVVAFLACLNITAFVSCNKEHQINEVKKESNVSKRNNMHFAKTAAEWSNECEAVLNNIGTIHNNSLMYAFDKIQNENLFSGLDSPSAVLLIENLTNEYMNNYFSSISFSYVSSFTNPIKATILDSPSAVYNFSAIFQQKITEFYAEMDETTSSEAFNTYGYSFLNDNISSIPPNEQVAFKAAVLIGINSLEYWNSNMVSWINEYRSQNNLPLVSGRMNGVNVAKADIEGAVGGALSGGISGAFAGGIGAFPGAVLGATWGAAVGSGVNMTFQSLFPGW